ncbi:rCG38510 [Rattus norvegicus]|uniref:RCG38510 n=1 Tax=Rattus norvegicus TaxID=10116 RepID=A6KM69_RAT|nr:rCG38510 [Rattus norvegicus]
MSHPRLVQVRRATQDTRTHQLQSAERKKCAAAGARAHESRTLLSGQQQAWASLGPTAERDSQAQVLRPPPVQCRMEPIPASDGDLTITDTRPEQGERTLNLWQKQWMEKGAHCP